jgi:hypothetical protein
MLLPRDRIGAHRKERDQQDGRRRQADEDAQGQQDGGRLGRRGLPGNRRDVASRLQDEVGHRKPQRQPKLLHEHEETVEHSLAPLPRLELIPFDHIGDHAPRDQVADAYPRAGQDPQDKHEGHL